MPRYRLKGLFITLILSFICSGLGLAQGQSSNPSDHSRYMKGPYPDGIAVTRHCLSCHENVGKEVLESAHWLWKGPAPFIAGYEASNGIGKKI